MEFAPLRKENSSKYCRAPFNGQPEEDYFFPGRSFDRLQPGQRAIIWHCEPNGKMSKEKLEEIQKRA